MNFQSLEFVALFLPLSWLAYWLLPDRYRNATLLLANAVFYAQAQWQWLPLLALQIAAVYASAIGLESGTPARRRGFFALGLMSTLGMLVGFKLFADQPGWILPLGLSFYSFKSMSYLLDVRRRTLPACRNPINLALSLSFFSHIIAGPIERPKRTLAQAAEPKRFDLTATMSGVVLIAWGYFKKLVIANALSPLASNIFDMREPGLALVAAGMLAYTFFIYADFSGYSDIARGISRLFGYDILPNFRAPLIARGISDFWNRWHISLSSFLQEYVFLPIVMSQPMRRIFPKRPQPRLVSAAWLTFFLSGLWHGSGANYVAFGLWHCACLFGGVGLKRLSTRWITGVPLTRIASAIGWLLTFVAISIGFLLFRESNLAYVLQILGMSGRTVLARSSLEGEGAIYFAGLALVHSVPLWLEAWWLERGSTRAWFWQGPLGAWLTSLALILLILLLGRNSALDFVYMRF